MGAGPWIVVTVTVSPLTCLSSWGPNSRGRGSLLQNSNSSSSERIQVQNVGTAGLLPSTSIVPVQGQLWQRGGSYRNWITGSMSTRPFEGMHSPTPWNDKLVFNSRPHREECFSVFMASNKHSNCLLYSKQPNSSYNVIIIENPS